MTKKMPMPPQHPHSDSASTSASMSSSQAHEPATASKHSNFEQGPSRFRVLTPEQARARSAPTPPLTSPSASSAFSKSGLNTSSHFAPLTQRQSIWSRFRSRYAALPTPMRRGLRVLRILAPVVPIGIFFSEHVLQVMWVRGSSMTPYLNPEYEQTHTKSDMVLVNMWPWETNGPMGWLPWGRQRRLERGMIVTFRWVCKKGSLCWLS